jgi:hypothetical protein
MSEVKSLQGEPKRFSRKELEEMLSRAQNGIVEIAIKKAVGHIKATCLKNFLNELSKSL